RIYHTQHWHFGILVYHSHVAVLFQRWYFRLHVGNQWSRRDATKVFFYHFQHLGGIYIATDGKRCIIWSIPSEKEIFKVFYSNPVQVFNITDGKPGVGMTIWIQIFASGF